MTQMISYATQRIRNMHGFLVTRTGNSTVSVGIGECSDQNNVLDMEIKSTVVVDLSTNGVNGLDSGTVAADTWYYLYAITNSKNNYEAQAIFSKNRIEPQLPHPYDSYRLIDYWRTDNSSNIIEAANTGEGNYRSKWYKDKIIIASYSTDTNWVVSGLTNSGVPPIPSGAVVYFQTKYTPNSTSGFFQLSDFNNATTPMTVKLEVAAAEFEIPVNHRVRFDGVNSYIYSKISHASDVIELYTLGFQYSV